MSDVNELVNAKAEKAVSMIEKATEMKFAFLLLSICLAADIALSLSYGYGLAEFDPRLSASRVSLGAMIVFLVGYVLFMAAASPFVQGVIESTLADLEQFFPMKQILGFFEKDPVSYERKWSAGFVGTGEAAEHALREKDSFWSERIEKAKSSLHKSVQDSRFIGRVSFSCTLLLIADAMYGADTSIPGLIARIAITNSMEWVAGVLSYAAVLYIATPWLMAFARRGYVQAWIEHPQLAEQFLLERAKNRRISR